MDDRELIIGRMSEHLMVTPDEAAGILEKAEIGGEVIDGDFDGWFVGRFLPNIVWIDEEGYAAMCIDALKILSTTAATDYGSSRQRDFGHMWADMTRGYLGELAFKLFLEKRGVKIELGHEKGNVSEYLPSDIHGVSRDDEPFSPPCITIGIKATKWNGIWLDIPGDQFSHSFAHVFIKVGMGRDHLFAYLKKISVFRDKVLKTGKDMGIISSEEADTMYDRIPTFRPIPAYVCGFVYRDVEYGDIPYRGKKGRKNYNITGWNGPIRSGDLDVIKKKESVLGSVKFEGIGSFAHDKGYLFNTGNLLWSEKDWNDVIARL